jgi:sigma-54 dependent transcriptional regulator, acetoin dehydrogenase operon transcriptional activator AcoR
MKGVRGRNGPEVESIHRSAPSSGRLTEHRRQTMAAWERFVSGDDSVRGIPAPVLLSWYRCRDVHKVDPYLVSPPRAAGRSSSALVYNSVFAQLGGIAASIVEHSENCLATVTDGDGQILASWGSGAASSRAADSNLAPFFSWSESATGTNGMGTALKQPWPMAVRGPEHWCKALHGWNCLGMGIYDEVTGDTVAALNVSAWEDQVPILPSEMTSELRIVRKGLREQAKQDAAAVARAFVEAAQAARGELIAVDAAGGIIAANDRARFLLGGPSAGFMLDPAERREHRSELQEVAKNSVQRARREPRWVGSVELGYLLGKDQIFEIRPVASPDGVIGLLISSENSSSGEKIDAEASTPVTSGPPNRIMGMRNGCTLFLSPGEVRYAEARRHDVWLATDQGRLRAATRGLDNMERELSRFGFLRIHRSYIVNVKRICEIDHHGKGVLTLSTNPQRKETIPVSRRYAVKLRQILGL